MELEHWAKVTAGHIARLGELTKREIQVVNVLFLCRNGSNNRCDPRRKTIAALANLPAPGVTLALAGLERKGWIYEMEDGSFHLFDPQDIPTAGEIDAAEKVTNLITPAAVQNSVENPAEVTNLITPADNAGDPEVTNLVTPVINSVKNSYQNGNAHIKDLNRQLTEKEQTARAAKKPRRKKADDPLIFPKPVRIPEPFELSDDMVSWLEINTPGLRVAEAIEDFVEHWTNRRDKKALATNWRLRWQKGMRLKLAWQRRDDAAANVAGGVVVDQKDCDNCGGVGSFQVNDFPNVPCEKCRPADANRFWKSRGR